MAQAVGIGIVASFFFTELSGIAPGGLIVPGYLAFFLHQPIRVILTFLVAICTYLIVIFLANQIIIYGRRRFMACVLTGYILGWLATKLITRLPLVGSDLQVIGYIIPGLIANEMVRQGIWRTILATLTVAAVVRLIMILLLF